MKIAIAGQREDQSLLKGAIFNHSIFTADSVLTGIRSAKLLVTVTRNMDIF